MQKVIIFTLFSDFCLLPSETGVCRAYFERYYFDQDEGQCKVFVYGGCGGNENNFETIHECEVDCMGKEVESESNSFQ